MHACSGISARAVCFHVAFSRVRLFYVRKFLVLCKLGELAGKTFRTLYGLKTRWPFFFFLTRWLLSKEKETRRAPEAGVDLS